MALLTILTLSLVLSPTSYHPTPAHAATTIRVTTLDDEINIDGDCSLREAITAANTNTARDACPAGSDPGPDNIFFNVDGTITLTSSLPLITTAITLDGSGRTLVIDGDSRFVTNGSVFCRVLVENSLFVRLLAEVGNPEVLSRSVIQAVDVFALYHDGSPTAYLNHPISVCLQGSGVLLYLDATAAPRLVVELPAFMQSGYTCTAVPHAGTVVLVSGRASDVTPALQISAPAGPTTPLADCRVTTRAIVNLREQPGTSGTLLRLIPYDVTLTALERTAGWFYVDYLGERGWISAGYVTPQGGCGE